MYLEVRMFLFLLKFNNNELKSFLDKNWELSKRNTGSSVFKNKSKYYF